MSEVKRIKLILNKIGVGLLNLLQSPMIYDYHELPSRTTFRSYSLTDQVSKSK